MSSNTDKPTAKEIQAVFSRLRSQAANKVSMHIIRIITLKNGFCVLLSPLRRKDSGSKY